MKQALLYSIKVWLTSGILTPFIFDLIATLSSLHPNKNLHLTGADRLILILVGSGLILLLTFIPWLITMFSVSSLLKQPKPTRNIKWIVFFEVEIMLAVLSILLPLCLDHRLDMHIVIYWISLAITTAIAVGAYKLELMPARAKNYSDMEWD